MIYPCVYREHCLSRLQASAVRGLSLCIQGTLYIHCFLIALLRFIPVHTGNIMKSLFSFLYKSVYPCAYREHHTLKITHLNVDGLSLCIQGTCARLVMTLCEFRFIPVHTGNIVYLSLLVHVDTVYPCAYREHSELSSRTVGVSGLSLCIQGTYQL